MDFSKYILQRQQYSKKAGYLVLEKLLISVVAFVSREWMMERLVMAYRPIHYPLLALLIPSVWIADRLMDMEDAREEDEEEREEEERAFIDVATEDGIIEEEEKELIQSVLDFGETVVREIMTPRTDIAAAPEDAGYGELVAQFRQVKHSRLPVYRDSIDDIVGVIHLKDLIQADEETFRMDAYIQKPFYVPETKNVAELLREMQKARTKMAVILDEYGGTAGLVTIEDLVEEIVGEIEDEHDALHEEIRQVEPDVWLVDGRCNLETLESETGISFELDEVDTMGGAVFSIFGRVPTTGESAVYGPWRVTVERMDRRRVVSVRIQKMEPADAAGSEDGKP